MIFRKSLGPATSGTSTPTSGKPAVGMTDADGDSGSATIWTVALVAALLMFATGILAVGSATVTRHRAAGAADLAALAAADYAPDGEQAACGWARWVTDRMRVQLVSCQLAGWDALVQTSAEPPGPLARFGAATAHARAGPTDR
jgi:secretion/DNA translocation related TadE-like protein